MNSIELFAGAGGLAMGCEIAGFTPLAVIERDKWACDTIRENRSRDFPLVAEWPLYKDDVREFDWSKIPQGIDLIAGGPPCQPFSLGGKHRAYHDDRDMFPPTVEIIRQLQPKAFLIENVRGLTRSSFANYYQYILLQLQFPEIQRKKDEGWFDHLLRLQIERSAAGQIAKGLTYNVVPTLVNAANYGIPQNRERVFIVGFRSDLGIEWSFPRATHSLNALLLSQWITGNYWERHKISNSKRPKMPLKFEARIRKLSSLWIEDTGLPLRTVRDALCGLPDPEMRDAQKIRDHIFQPGARRYPGHTGSVLDLPAKTLKAGDHGVPGGENMMVKDNDEVRYFTIRESARLQTFPDGYHFHGSWTESMRQLGNAVPVMLAQRVASSIAECLIKARLSAVESFERSTGDMKRWAS